MDYIFKKQMQVNDICILIAKILRKLQTTPEFIEDIKMASKVESDIFANAKGQERVLISWFNLICKQYHIPLSMSSVTPGETHEEDLKFGDIRISVKGLTPLIDNIYCDLKVGTGEYAGAITFRSFTNFTPDGIYITMNSDVSKCYIIKSAELNDKVSELTWSCDNRHNYTTDQIVANTTLINGAFLSEKYNYGNIFAEFTTDKLALGHSSLLPDLAMV